MDTSIFDDQITFDKYFDSDQSIRTAGYRGTMNASGDEVWIATSGMPHSVKIPSGRKLALFMDEVLRRFMFIDVPEELGIVIANIIW